MPTYNFGLKIGDCSGALTVNCLGESGESILGMNSVEFHGIHGELDRVKALAMSQQWKPMTMTLQGKLSNNAYS